MFDVVIDAVLDSIKILPILFLMYLLIAVIESKSALSIEKGKFINSKWAPLFGAGVGIVPQCGFSVVATDLYTKKKIALGTLLAIYIATSDEAIPIMLGEPSSYKYIIPFIIVKFLYAVLVGYGTFFVLSIYAKLKKEKMYTAENNLTKNNAKRENTKALQESATSIKKSVDGKLKEEEHNHQHHHDHEQDAQNHLKTDEKINIGCCGHEIEKDQTKLSKFLWHPLIHAVKIFIFLLIVNLVLGLIIYFVGEEQISNFLITDSIWQPFLACLVGLIPNCAASVIITELYLMGALSFGSCVAGLSVNAGIALAVLFKNNKNVGKSFAIVGTLYILGCILGVVTCLIMA